MPYIVTPGIRALSYDAFVLHEMGGGGSDEALTMSACEANS